ncbi:sigma 54-interacting transcriptional regulator [Thioclava sp.]|uniref:sigma 54-interacting transcriptional regulator n=1 Tax=Thioclava sp. TaxID=1933450 RepID=UPI003AA95158
MSDGIWPDHPIFSAQTQQEAEARLELFDDGLVLLSGDGGVVQMTSEAARQLGLRAELAAGRPLSDFTPALRGWDALVAAVSDMQGADCLLKREDGRDILAVLRQMPGHVEGAPVRMIVLRDLSGLDYRRERAGGHDPARSHVMAEKRTRPDFVTQRRLAPDLHRVLSRGERAIMQGARILITGESGVGKTEIAKFLHGTVADADAPFVVANCASSSDALFTRALFGGDGTAGLIGQAERGTLFLDEVAEIPLSAQALLLRFLEDGLVTSPTGGQQRVTNVRVIAATNGDLRQMIRDGAFRADLYYRLAVVPLRVPPLRDMPTLIDHLINRFLQTINQRRKTPVVVSRRMREVLADYSYPGNIRELLNIVQKLAIFLEETDDMAELMEDLLSPIDIPGTDRSGASTGPVSTTYDLRSEVRRYERTLIDRAIRIHGSKRKAAQALGVDIGTIVRKTADPVAANTDNHKKTTNSGENKP